MTNLILNIIGIIFGAFGSFISITKKDTWNNKQPTKTGWIATASLAMVVVTQIDIQLLDFIEKTKLRKAFEAKYQGWVSIGTFHQGKWTCKDTKEDRCPLLTGQGIDKTTSPESIKTNTSERYLVATELYGYKSLFPDRSCLEERQKPSTVFEKDDAVKIIDKKVYKCTNGNKRVLLKVIGIPF